MAKVFISYRRATASGHALLIYDHLRRRLPDVFRDQNSLTPGERFRDELEQEIRHCEAMIVVVTPGWAEAFKSREANSERDWVLAEIRAALEAKKRIVPVLVGGATADELSKAAERLGLAPETGIQPISLHDKGYETDLDNLARLLWSWPPPLYWVSSTLLLAAAVTFAVWLHRAAAWAADWWGPIVVLLLAWFVPNAVVLSGRIYPRLPGMGGLRGIASSQMGLFAAFGCIAVATAAAAAWRIVRVEGSATRASATYQLKQGQTSWSREIDSRALHTYWFTPWSWTPVEVSGTDGLGRCVTAIPRAFSAFTVRVPDDLVSNAIVIRAGDTLVQDLNGADVGLTIVYWWGDRKEAGDTIDPYRAKPVSRTLTPCESRPTAVEITWTKTESSPFDHIKQLGLDRPKRYDISGTEGAIVLEGSK